MNRIIRFAIVGLLGALIGWLILEPTPLMPNDGRGVGPVASMIVGMTIGGFIGFGIGLISSQSGFSNRDGVKVILSGILVGAGGGIVGLSLGNIIWAPFARMERQDITPLIFLAVVFGRSIGWALIGCFIGLSQGIAVMSNRKMISGAVGGFIGGGAGGLVFQLMAFSATFAPAMVRFVSFAMLGFAVGLFIGIADEVAKKAWLVKDLGRGEGKQFEIFRTLTVLGRDELADVPVYGDNMVAKKHAQISLQNNRYILEDLGSTTGTTVNGTRITSQQLKDGDIIHLGTSKFIFKTKVKSYAVSTAAGQAVAQYVPPSAIDGLVCPFCGQAKDAQGNCACSVGSAPQPAANQTIVNLTDYTPQQTVRIDGIPVAQLTGISGPYTAVNYKLNPVQTIGRETGRDISLPKDPTVSRNHARIVYENAQWFIEDIGSANGTYVDEMRVTRRELVPGNIIRVGNCSFRFDA